MAESKLTINEIGNTTVDELTKCILRSLKSSLSQNKNRNKDLKLTPYDGAISYRVEDFIDEYEERARGRDWTNSDMFERFGLYLDGTAKSWYKLTLQANPKPPTDWFELKELFIKEFMPKDKKRYFRNLIAERKQKYTESVLHYIIDIRCLCFRLDENMKETDVIDYLFDGLLPSFKKEFERHKCKTIDEFEEFARKIEKANAHFNVEEPKYVPAKSIEGIKNLKSDISSQFSSMLQKIEKFKRECRESSQNNCDIDDYDQRFESELDLQNPSPDYYNVSPEFYYHGGISNLNTNSEAVTNTIDQLSPGIEQESDSSESPVGEDLHNSNEDMCDSFQGLSLYKQTDDGGDDEIFLIREICSFCGNEDHCLEECEAYLESSSVHFIKTKEKFNKLLYRSFEVKGLYQNCLIDTGSEVSLIDFRLCKKLKNDIYPYFGFPLRGANNHYIKTKGVTYLQIKPYSGKMIEIRAIVVIGLGLPIILGNDFNKQSGIIINYGDDTISYVNQIV